jgi:hypothetical protein
MAPQQEQTLQGTWKEVLRQAEALDPEQEVRLTIVTEGEEATNGSGALPRPNEAALAALREIAKRQEGRRETSAEDTDRLLREARAGGMYGYDPTE